MMPGPRRPGRPRKWTKAFRTTTVRIDEKKYIWLEKKWAKDARFSPAAILDLAIAQLMERDDETMPSPEETRAILDKLKRESEAKKEVADVVVHPPG